MDDDIINDLLLPRDRVQIAELNLAREIYHDIMSKPMALVTDADLVLLSEIREIFPESYLR